ncbi:hypothetical protein Q4E93_34355 [Flavitalea sp. BT771]|uniref:hypothetical protein n=1 Tax=Flavitalea sp. BT771 TaxID=3063329 RepID=UPI0026E45056|nr:hypothetical protein [Flavitalea sp. BT771]MDO6435748.1 hypothetical protein [Flavitalea sp. BT771]MDV6224649.1 hypothetical protein [Flavitalea sp. BT771]
MKKKRTAKICDGVLEKFRGNKSFDWDAMHDKDFYSSIDDDYFEIENVINFLLGQGVNELEKYEYDGKTYIRLTPKGIYTISDLRNEGYIAKWKGKWRENFWKRLVAIITVCTFILVSYRFYKDFIDGNQRMKQPTNAIKTDTSIQRKDSTKFRRGKDSMSASKVPL